MYVVVAIPARIKSSRLPNKVLAEIKGKPMIKRVLEQVSKTKLVDELYAQDQVLMIQKFNQNVPHNLN